MKPTLLAWTLAISAVWCSLPAHGTPIRYNLVTKVSRVSFQLSHQGFIQLLGTLRIAPGQIVFDEQDWHQSSVTVQLPTPSLDLGDALWNQQVRDDDSWQALFRQPNISFRSTDMRQLDATHGTLAGELTIGNMTKLVSMSLLVNKLGKNAVSGQPSVGFAAHTSIRRSDFGLTAYLDLVGDEIQVQIQIEATTAPDPEPIVQPRALGIAPAP